MATDLYNPNNLGNIGFPTGFFNHAAAIAEEHELTPGYPQQFHYPETKMSPLYTQKENLSINLSPFHSDVVQNSQKDPIIGRYQSMVYDVPFDTLNYEKTKDNLTLMGFGFFVASLMFF